MESKTQKHKRWRKQFNEDCLKRDGNKCVFCDITKDLDVHHITNRKKMPNGGYVMSNGITVCGDHHIICESWWEKCDSRNRTFSPISLYQIIGSSYEQALKDSEKLE